MPTDLTCPACGGGCPEVLLAMGSLPVHTTRLMHGRAMALDFPRGDLDLVACHHCGFLFNGSYDPSLQDYLPDSEEAQTHSAVFSSWQTRLIEQLCRDQALCERPVIEIGCGKGAFLFEFCRASNSIGVGYDPAFRGAVPEDLNGQVEIIADYWDMSRGLHGASTIICRHTLEHIGPVRDFLTGIRRAIGDDLETRILFEVPDAERVLAEGAFWDIYYEHCSYFSRASLSGLFERCGFIVDDCWLEFDEQYILLLARPAPEPAHPADGSAGATGLRASFTDFRAHYESTRTRWLETLAAAARRQEEVVLWGGGSKAAAFLAQIPGAEIIHRVVDINPMKQGKFIPGTGQRVVAPEDLVASPPGLVIAMNPIYNTEITRQLSELGVVTDLIAL